MNPLYISSLCRRQKVKTDRDFQCIFLYLESINTFSWVISGFIELGAKPSKMSPECFFLESIMNRVAKRTQSSYNVHFVYGWKSRISIATNLRNIFAILGFYWGFKTKYETCSYHVSDFWNQKVQRLRALHAAQSLSNIFNDNFHQS